MPTAPSLVAAYSALTTGNLTSTSPSLSLQAGDIVVVLAMGEGANSGDTWSAPTTTFANGGVTQLQLHAASSNNCNGGAWTFTVSTTGSGTVSIVQTQGAAGTKVQTVAVLAYRGGVAPTSARSAQQAGSGRTISYTASQADSAMCYIIGDWAAAAVQTPSPSSAHTSASPGPTATPYSLASGTAMTGYAVVYDDQTLTTAQTYGIGGSGTGPFTIVVVEVQGTGGSAAAPRVTHAPTRIPVFRAATY